MNVSSPQTDCKPRRVLVIDDNASVQSDFRKILEQTPVVNELASVEAQLFGEAARVRRQMDFRIEGALQGQLGLEMVKRGLAADDPYLLAFVDMRMPPGWDGIQTIKALWKADPELQVVICTAYCDSSWDQIIEELGSTDRMLILKKPFDVVEVCQLATALTEKWLVTRQANLKIADMERLIGARTAELTRVSLHDRLTGLPNRQLFHDRLAHAMDQARRHPGQRCAVMFLDFDRFKVVNDSLGHEIGDLLLCAIAERINTVVRQTDTVSVDPAQFDVGDATAARLGGDEFIILLENLAEDRDAARVAERLLACLSKPYSLKGHVVHSTVSIGITTGSGDYATPEAMVRDADAAMYRAKATGKARYVLFDKRMHEQAMGRLTLENDLRTAAASGQLRVHYQPIICLATGMCQGVEALVRWQHPTRGLVGPGEFIPVAEETGEIVAIDTWVLTEGCRQLVEWRSRNPALAGLSLSVNFSRRQLTSPDVLARLARVISASGVDPRGIKLELTESAIMEDPEGAVEVLRQIRRMNLQLMMDDFGTAYSSLSCLHRFPLSGLKLDRSFIKNVSERRHYAAIVHAIVMLAQNLDMQLVAEGVETAGQTALLQSLGCESAQGFFFARPMPAGETEAYLRSNLEGRAAA